MSRVAIHHWQGRVAPVFDTGGQILVSIERAGEWESRILVQSYPMFRAEELANLEVDVLICGAISQAMQEALAVKGIRVMGFVTGEVVQVMEAWRHGNLDETFVMPGCRGLGFGRDGQGRRQRQHRRVSCHEGTEQDHKDSDRKQAAGPGCVRIRNWATGRRSGLSKDRRVLAGGADGGASGGGESAGG